MTETQHDPRTAQPNYSAQPHHQAQPFPQPQWAAPQPTVENTLQAREGEYAWRGPGQQSAQPQPTGPFGPIPGAPPGPGHAAEPRRRSPMKFGLGVVAALVLVSAGV